ncbi:hypothetical protein [Microbispora siamensis]|uniref:hypothetical protein n=1 Tax=Microbispora siamensis TaxID=564413 RepID=UPI00194DC093|nr:hypothetical protein [Microbispora siamensis]
MPGEFLVVVVSGEDAVPDDDVVPADEVAARVAAFASGRGLFGSSTCRRRPRSCARLAASIIQRWRLCP